MANDWNYRPILLLIIFAVELHDIFAYICGHLFGHRKFVPNTSPNKTVGGALGATVLTTALFAIGAHFVWPRHLAGYTGSFGGPGTYRQHRGAIRGFDALFDPNATWV
jgi:CDP-diglyceride synthetase